MGLAVRRLHDIHIEGEFSTLKNGKQGKRWITTAFWCTKLRTCQVCGLVSTPKRVQYRSTLHGWDLERGDYVSETKSTLCMGCYNKVRHIYRVANECEKLLKSIRRMKRDLHESAKNHT